MLLIVFYSIYRLRTLHIIAAVNVYDANKLVNISRVVSIIDLRVISSVAQLVSFVFGVT